MNLQLVKGLLPDLKARGRAEPTYPSKERWPGPRITGRATVRDAAATYGDFPVGLSKMNGDLLFDKTRLVFDRIDAESGGGQLLLERQRHLRRRPAALRSERHHVASCASAIPPV